MNTTSPWPTARVGDFAEVVTGGTPSTSARDYWDGGTVPWLNSGELNKGLITRADNYITKAGLANSAAAMMPKGTVLVALTGATTGVSALLDVEACANQSVTGILPSPVHDSHFLLHYLRSVRKQVVSDSWGGAQKHISQAYVKALMVPLPPLPEQRRIAEVLDRAEALRAKRRAALAQLDTLTQAIFLDMFGDPATNPKGWPRKSISDVATVITGNTPPRAVHGYYGQEIEWIKSDNINTPHDFLTRASEGLSALGKAVARVAPAGSVLVTCIAGSPECIGNAAMTDREVAFNQQINAVVPRDVDSRFLYVQFLVGKSLIQRASTSSMKGMVSKSRLERIMLMCPPVVLQKEFASRVEAVGRIKAAHQASLAKLDALFASLQDRAFRGEL